MSSPDLSDWFNRLQQWLEPSYLACKEPWRQSGMSGPEDRWTALRRPVADCITHDGTFLDIGCANGYLLECCMRWNAERSVEIEPYGLDLSSALVELARQRLPGFADHFFVGNALYWKPPLRFDFVRTELCYVPSSDERRYIDHLLENYLSPAGRLLIANYTEGMQPHEVRVLEGSSPILDLRQHLDSLGVRPVEFRDGHDPVKNRTVRIAVVTR